MATKTTTTRKGARAARRALERTKRRKKFARFINLLLYGARTRYALRVLGWTWENDVSWFNASPRLADRIRWAQRAGHEYRKEIIEGEMWQRAVVGVEEPIYARGQVIGARLRKSDSLLIALARKYLPHFFASRVEVTVSEGRSVRDLIKEIQDSINTEAAKRQDAPRPVASHSSISTGSAFLGANGSYVCGTYPY